MMETGDGSTGGLQVGGKRLSLSNNGSLQELRPKKSMSFLGGEAVSADDTLDSVEIFEKLKQSPHLIVLIVSEGNEAAWGQVSMFIEALRQDFLAHAQQPIVVLSPSEVDHRLQHCYKHQNCAFVSGKVLDSKTLRMAGVDVAKAVITFRGGTWEGFDAAHIVMEDYEVITLTNLIAKVWKGAGKRDRYSLYEFGSTLAVRLRELREAEKDKQDEEGRLPTQRIGERHVTKLAERLCPAYGCTREDLYGSFCAPSQSAFSQTLSKQLLFLPSFAAGQVFSPDFFGSVLGHIYNFPATIEFMETICMPHHNQQSSFSWQVRCPPRWVGRTFGELLCSWANGEEESGLLQESGPVLVIALYRSGGDDRYSSMVRNQGFNVTLPERSTVLNERDLITLLGPPAFGKSAAERSLLEAYSPSGETGLPPPAESPALASTQM